MAKKTTTGNTGEGTPKKASATTTTSTSDTNKPDNTSGEATSEESVDVPQFKKKEGNGNVAHLQTDNRKILINQNEERIDAQDYKVEKGAENLVHYIPLTTQVLSTEPYKRLKVKTISKQTLWEVMKGKVLQVVNGKTAFKISDNLDKAVVQGYSLLFYLTQGEIVTLEGKSKVFQPAEASIEVVKKVFDISKESDAIKKVNELMVFNPGTLQFTIRDILHLPGIDLQENGIPVFPEECLRKETPQGGANNLFMALID